MRELVRGNSPAEPEVTAGITPASGRCSLASSMSTLAAGPPGGQWAAHHTARHRSPAHVEPGPVSHLRGRPDLQARSCSRDRDRLGSSCWAFQPNRKIQPYAAGFTSVSSVPDAFARTCRGCDRTTPCALMRYRARSREPTTQVPTGSRGTHATSTGPSPTPPGRSVTRRRSRRRSPGTFPHQCRFTAGVQPPDRRAGGRHE